jgi:hypothetical protein
MSEIERSEVKVALTERIFIDGDGGGGGGGAQLNDHSNRNYFYA